MAVVSVFVLLAKGCIYYTYKRSIGVWLIAWDLQLIALDFQLIALKFGFEGGIKLHRGLIDWHIKQIILARPFLI